MSTEQEILVTGIKVVDLLAPYAKGGKIGEYFCTVHSCEFEQNFVCTCTVLQHAEVLHRS